MSEPPVGRGGRCGEMEERGGGKMGVENKREREKRDGREAVETEKGRGDKRGSEKGCKIRGEGRKGREGRE